MDAQRQQHRFVERQLRTEQQDKRTDHDAGRQPAELTQVLDLLRQMDRDRREKNDRRRNREGPPD
jgi:hypothetical protein